MTPPAPVLDPPFDLLFQPRLRTAIIRYNTQLAEVNRQTYPVDSDNLSILFGKSRLDKTLFQQRHDAAPVLEHVYNRRHVHFKNEIGACI